MSTPSVLSCPACRWSWGPVGVQPFVHGGPQQAFLICGACEHPQARITQPGQLPAELCCSRCGAAELRPLVRCPACGAEGLRWGPFMG
jgi:predicted amidophosphoribosyltransferase